MIPTTDSDGFFFRQTQVSSDILAVDSAKKPIASLELVIDRNLIRNGSLRFHLNGYIYRSYYIDFLFLYHFFFLHELNDFAMANLRVDVNEQTTESPGQFVHSTFNFSAFNLRTECSNGTHTFVSVPVIAYVMNVTGEFHLSLLASMGNPQTGYSRASVRIDTQIDSGNNLTPVLPSTMNTKFYFFMQAAVVTISVIYSAQESV